MNARERFGAIAQASDDDIDLAEASLWLAGEEYPGLDVPHYLSKIDALAEVARARVSAETTTPGRALALVQHLHDDLGFRGNETAYHDPRNSYLNEVLDRKLGIPITLCILYVEAARRLGLAAEGVGFPGHFLAKVECDEEQSIVDPFHGVLLSIEECGDRLRALSGGTLALDPDRHLQGSSKREILVRMLSNLKHIGLRSGDFERALGCCDRILLLTPDSPIEHRDRGLVHERLECHSSALIDYQRFLALSPDDETAPTVAQRVRELQKRVRHLN